ncbi:transglycosylase domain-containing protein [Corynebacterium sp. LK28]|uniref:transglycosylase domain-containing protein n=2 Tax=unclassified Corynebacterium TaxID=2624378 RepID=UPI00351C955E
MKKNGSRSVGDGKLKARTRKKRSWRDKRTLRNFFAGLAAVMAVMIIVPLVAFFTAYSVTKVPEPEELVNNQISYIMASDNNTELARIVPPEGNRQNVKLDEVPMSVRQAVLAAEDREFYSNPGFSVSGFARAAVGQVLGREGAGGGSTITQQYVKNALVGDEFSLSRKAKELVISAKMAREWSKDEILEAYLNTIYFGRNSYGISAASHAYFDKDVKDLTPEEGAVLAATIQAPSSLDPWTNRERAESRWNYVLDGMVGIGAMKEADRRKAVYPKVKDPAETAENTQAVGTNGLIKTKVIEELEQAGITEEQVNTGGLKITTTIDPKMQADAVDEIHKKMEGQQQGLRTAVASVDPKTGGVRAWYGGDDPVGFDFAGAGLQSGSTFKIFTLAAYLDQGGSLYDQFDSSPVMTGDAQVNNDGGASCGTCSIAEALKQSLNTSFIRLTQALKGGPQDVADMAHRLGVAESLPGVGKTLQEKNGKPADGITLGMYQSSPLDMATALATLTNGGIYHRPHFVQKVENSNGDVLLDNTNDDGDRVVSEEVANGVIQAMQPIAAYSNGNSLAGGRPSAAKTGTAQLGDTGENKDAWMIGSTPQLSTAVWVGTAEGKPIHNSYGGIMYGSGLPAQIWKGVMDRSLENTEIEQFNTGAAASSGYTGGYAGGGNAGGAAGADQPEEQEQESPAPASPASPPSPAPAPAPRQPAPQGGNRPPNNDLQNLLDGILNP